MDCRCIDERVAQMKLKLQKRLFQAVKELIYKRDSGIVSPNMKQHPHKYIYIYL